MSIYFLSFGGGSDDYNKALERIIKQAEEFNLFCCGIAGVASDSFEFSWFNFIRFFCFWWC